MSVKYQESDPNTDRLEVDLLDRAHGGLDVEGLGIEKSGKINTLTFCHFFLRRETRKLTERLQLDLSSSLVRLTWPTGTFKQRT